MDPYRFMSVSIKQTSVHERASHIPVSLARHVVIGRRRCKGPVVKKAQSSNSNRRMQALIHLLPLPALYPWSSLTWMTECQTCGKPAGDEKGIEQGCSLCKGSNLVIIRAMHWKGFCGGKFRNHGKEKQLEGRRSAETRVRVQDYGDCAMALSPERRRSTRVTMSI